MFSEKLYYSHLKTEVVGRKMTCLDETLSTNDYLLDKDTIDGEAVCALSQSKGRGRSGRQWLSGGGSLLFSVVLPVEKPALLMPANILAGFAVVDALREFADAKLKWPNDCVINGRKVCGMLIDTRFRGSTFEKAVLGIGINVSGTEFPPDIAHRAASVEQFCNKELSQEYIAAAVFNNLETLLIKYKKGAVDIEALFPYYSANTNKSITLHRMGELVTCTEKGIDRDGTLLVTLENGKTDAISAGEIGYDFSN